jgi:hypothetical protein
MKTTQPTDLTIPEAAAALSLSTWTLRRLIRESIVKDVICYGPRTRRITISDLDKIRSTLKPQQKG